MPSNALFNEAYSYQHLIHFGRTNFSQLDLLVFDVFTWAQKLKIQLLRTFQLELPHAP